MVLSGLVCQKMKWGIDSILQALYNLFSNSPAKREDYSQITGLKVFPLPFSGTRWIEDKKVADRALEIWPNITKYVNETLKSQRVKFQHQVTLPHSNQLYRMIS